MSGGFWQRLETGRGGNARLVSMEGLRGFAVLLVFFVHYTALALPWIEGAGVGTAVAERLADAGNVGVDLFFVLSGFLIYGNLMRHPQEYRPYVRHRLRRVYPTFLFVLGLYAVLSFVIPSVGKLPGRAIEIPPFLAINALLLPGVVPVESFITVAWSLSFEVFFYLTVPVLISKARLRERDSRWRVRYFLWWSLGLFVLSGAISGSHPRMVMFFGGMILWEWLTYRWPEQSDDPARVRAVDRWSLVALFGGLALSFALPGSFANNLPRIAVLFVAFPVLCAGCFAVDGTANRWFSWTPLRRLGNISYSYYLIHSLVLQAVFFGLERVWEPEGGNPWFYWVALVPVFALTVAGAVALFLGVEKPLSLDQRTRRLLRAGRARDRRTA